MRSGVLAHALVACALGACAVPNRSAGRSTGDAGVDAAPGTTADGGTFSDRPLDASAAPAPADAPPLPDAGPEPRPAGPNDGPVESPPQQPPDAEGAPACTPSGGACVCPAGACEDGVLAAPAASVSALAAAGDFLHYVLVSPGAPDAVHTVDLRSGRETGAQPAPAGFEMWPTLAADAVGAAYWCQRRAGSMPGLVGAVLRGTEVLAQGACKAVRVTPTHVVFSVEEESWQHRLYRRALGPGAAPAREAITASNPYGFDLTDTHVYFTTNAATGLRSLLQRVALDDVSRVQTLGERAGLGVGVFDRVAADRSHVYLSYNDEILRIPATGGELFQTFWSGGGVQIATIVLDATHVYWATEIPGVSRCSEAAFWRRSKLRDDDPVLLARREGLCPVGLALAGDRVYTAVVRPSGPSQILRLRR
jgi:hypothetical protein